DEACVAVFFRRFLALQQHHLRALDAFLLYVLLTGALQFGYCLGVGRLCFPLWLPPVLTGGSLFLCSAVCLRIQINPQNKSEFQGISPERAFADFLFANTILHLVVINFVG
uniref:Dolichyl-diphosphooligosaccharide--protein glycosyltransferase subunit DAD1 n=1 Tax=Ficedula albicollis TaxID=59894 RepID=U3JDV9_FICAL